MKMLQTNLAKIFGIIRDYHTILFQNYFAPFFVFFFQKEEVGFADFFFFEGKEFLQRFAKNFKVFLISVYL